MIRIAFLCLLSTIFIGCNLTPNTEGQQNKLAEEDAIILPTSKLDYNFFLMKTSHM